MFLDLKWMILTTVINITPIEPLICEEGYIYEKTTDSCVVLPEKEEWEKLSDL